MPFKLRNLVIDRVDLVDKGDNPEAHITLFKREGTIDGEGGDPQSNKSLIAQVEEIVKNIFKREGVKQNMEFDLMKFIENLNEEQRDAFKAKLEKASDTVKEAVTKFMKDLDEDERTSKMLDLTLDFQLLKAKKEEMPEEEEEEEDKKKEKQEDEEEEEEETMKRLPEHIQKMIKESQQKAEAAAVEVAKYKEEKEISEYITKAKAYPMVIAKAEEVGPVLKRIAATSPEDFAVIEGVLKAAEERLSKNDQIMKEMGTDGDQTGDAWAKIDAKAEEYRKADSSLTKEQAIAKVARENPKLYGEYVNQA